MIKRINAATVIQTYRRAQLARRTFDLAKLNAKEKLALMKVAVAFDQIAHRDENYVHVSKIKDPFERRIAAVEVIQRHWHLGRKEFTSLNLSEEDEATVVAFSLQTKLKHNKHKKSLNERVATKIRKEVANEDKRPGTKGRRSSDNTWR